MQTKENYLPFTQHVQRVEQRSISFPNLKDNKGNIIPHPGVQSLPAHKVDLSLYNKTKGDKILLKRLKSQVVLLGHTITNSLSLQAVN